MKGKFKSIIISALVLALTFCVMVPTAFAAGIMPLTDYQSAKYTITESGGTWDGSDVGALWYVDDEETRFNLSITSSSEKTVTAKYYKVIEYFPDSLVCSISLTGMDGDWVSSDYYSLDHLHAYYAKVTTTSSKGAEGRVSIQS